MIKKLLFTVLMLTSISALSRNVEYNYIHTSDNDGVKVNKHTLSTKYNLLDVGINNTEYLTPNGRFNSQSLLISPNLKLNKFETTGNIGVGQLSNKNYLTGDLTGTFNLTNNFKSHLTIFGDAVDATSALTANTYFYGFVKTVEYSNDNFGIVLGPKVIKFSNNNTQNGYIAKTWLSVADGVNIYISTKDYKNSLPFNGIYYSPDTYNRTGYGISVRKKISNVKISAMLEKSTISTVNGKEPTTTWKLQIEKPISNNLTGILTTGKDYGTVNQFKYQHTGITIKYDF